MPFEWNVFWRDKVLPVLQDAAKGESKWRTHIIPKVNEMRKAHKKRKEQSPQSCDQDGHSDTASSTAPDRRPPKRTARYRRLRWSASISQEH